MVISSRPLNDRTSAATSIKNHLRAVAEKNLDIAHYFHGQARAEGRTAQGFVNELLGRVPVP